MIYKTKIDGSLFKISKLIAELDYENYTKKKGSGQNPNALRGCLVGVIGERAVFLYLNDRKYTDIIPYGMRERETGKKDWNNADIHFKNKTGRECKAEVKTIRKGSPRGQITVIHGDKYLKEEIDAVFFVEIILFDKSADCTVYEILEPSKIVALPVRNNFFGIACYTKQKGE